MDAPLLKFVTDAVAAYQGKMTALARDADVPYSWLVMFARGEIENPGILQIEKLAAHFKNGKTVAPPTRNSSKAATA
jgi:hypothetical protein